MDNEKEKLMNKLLSTVFRFQTFKVYKEEAMGLKFNMYDIFTIIDLKDVSSLPGLERVIDTTTLTIHKLVQIFQNGVELNLGPFLRIVIDTFNSSVRELNTGKPILHNNTVDRFIDLSREARHANESSFLSMFVDDLQTDGYEAVVLVCALGSRFKRGLKVFEGSHDLFYIYDPLDESFAHLAKNIDAEQSIVVIEDRNCRRVSSVSDSELVKKRAIRTSLHLSFFKYHNAAFEQERNQIVKQKEKINVIKGPELYVANELEGWNSLCFRNEVMQQALKELEEFGATEEIDEDL